MPVEVLSKAQRNALFDAVADCGLPMSDFSYLALPSSKQSATDEAWIKHVPSDSRFAMFPERDSSLFKCNSRIGDDPTVPLDYRMNFTEVLAHVRSWGVEVADWINAPDLWELARSGNAFIPGERSPDSENTPFTLDEQAAISAQLREIREAVKKTYELTAEQSKHVDEKFEEAEKASGRMGRKDWGMFFGGAILSLILCDAITPAIMGDILMMVQHGVGHLFIGGPPSLRGVLSAGQG
jgi:hypothetical protein